MRLDHQGSQCLSQQSIIGPAVKGHCDAEAMQMKPLIFISNEREMEFFRDEQPAEGANPESKVGRLAGSL